MQVHVGVQTEEIVLGERHGGRASRSRLADGGELAVDMVVVSAGIRPRDELARACGSPSASAAASSSNAGLRTSDPHIYRDRRVRAAAGIVYGLVGPGYEMADRSLADRLCGGDASVHRRRSLHEAQAARRRRRELRRRLRRRGARHGAPSRVVFDDRVRGVYQKLVLSADGRRLLGGILVGDAERLRAAPAGGAREAVRVPERPQELLFGTGAGGRGCALRRRRQLCSCNNVTAATIREAIRGAGAHHAERREDLHAGRHRAAAAASRCVTQILRGRAGRDRADGQPRSLRALPLHAPGALRDREARAHRRASRRCSRATGAAAAARSAGRRSPRSSPARGTTSSLNHATDPGHQRPLPREHPARRHLLGGAAHPGRRDHAREADRARRGREAVRPLRARSRAASASTCSAHASTSSRRSGRRWSNAGFESGHAYGKALRTVKSCVGSTWCRYGVQDSTALAIRVEERYRGIRAPHKLKSAVSGCIRECAEAQSKDFGVIATERGLEPLRRRQRRLAAAARRPARGGPRRGDADPAHRPLPHVLHPHRATRSSAPHAGSSGSKAASST